MFSQNEALPPAVHLSLRTLTFLLNQHFLHPNSQFGFMMQTEGGSLFFIIEEKRERELSPDVLENLRRILSRKQSLVEIALKTMKWEMLQGELLYAFLKVSHCHSSVVRAVMVGEFVQKPRDLWNNRMREQIHLHLRTSWHLRSILNQLGSEKLRENMGAWHSRIFSGETSWEVISSCFLWGRQWASLLPLVCWASGCWFFFHWENGRGRAIWVAWGYFTGRWTEWKDAEDFQCKGWGAGEVLRRRLFYIPTNGGWFFIWEDAIGGQLEPIVWKGKHRAEGWQAAWLSSIAIQVPTLGYQMTFRSTNWSN